MVPASLSIPAIAKGSISQIKSKAKGRDIPVNSNRITPVASTSPEKKIDNPKKTTKNGPTQDTDKVYDGVKIYDEVMTSKSASALKTINKPKKDSKNALAEPVDGLYS